MNTVTGRPVYIVAGNEITDKRESLNVSAGAVMAKARNQGSICSCTFCSYELCKERVRVLHHTCRNVFTYALIKCNTFYLRFIGTHVYISGRCTFLKEVLTY